MKTVVGLCMAVLAWTQGMSQVDTSFIYRTNNPYGTLDLRLAKSATRYYYLRENKTFSFRESSPGVKTDSYRDMTSWDSSPYSQGHLREKNGTSDYFVMNYRLLFPVNYDPAYAEGYPFIVMIHGGGERGNCWDPGCHWADVSWRPLTNTPAAPTNADHQLLNNDHNLLHGGLVHLNARNLAGNRLPNDPTMPTRAFPGFVLFPQNLNGWDANQAQDVIKLIRLLSKKYNVDENRIYIHGLSNGGFGTYEVTKRAPWMFAAALPMSAISDASITLSTYTSVLNDVKHIPFWMFQGGIDTNPVPSKTRTTVKKLRDVGAIVRYNEYPNLGHGVWNTAYNEPDFFSWILQQNKSNIHVFGGIAAICMTTGQGVRMELARGFKAYQWEKDGAIITDATSASYTANTPGIYRARFSRISTTPNASEWNKWSDPVTVYESNPPQAQIMQKGSVILKDLNNYNNAHLTAVGDYAHYYWYKNGALLDLPGTQDDTTKNPIFKQGTCTDLPACTGNGVYTLVTSGLDNCPSPPSEPKYIYFNNQAPINITAPATFTGSATSPSSTQISWTDSSPNELGFEVWRRKRTGTTTFTYSKWTLSVLTAPNVTSFTDRGLEPSTLYQYKIRAVGSSGRSNYTPSSSSQYLVITTLADGVEPSAPQNLTAASTGIREISLSWQASTDNTGIRRYMIFVDDDTVVTSGPATTWKLQNLELNHEFTFTIKAVDLGGNLSQASNTATANTVVTGLYYEHSTGSWSDLDLINWNIAEYRGTVNTVTLAPRTQEDYFNFEFDGYLHITVGGTYQFRTTSDDGSRLTLNNVVIVDNDGLHGNVTVTSTDQLLPAGPQLANIKYFEATGGQTLTVQYKGPDTGNSWITIPQSAWKSGDSSDALLSARMASTESKTKPTLYPTLNIYPNPVRPDDAITLAVADNNEAETVRVRLVSMMGEIMYEKIMDPKDIQGQFSFTPDRQITKGIYILVFQQGDAIVKERVVVQD
jgi:predicted esterase